MLEMENDVDYPNAGGSMTHDNTGLSAGKSLTSLYKEEASTPP